MFEAAIATPLGTAHIKGDERGITEISVSDEAPKFQPIPDALAPACKQLTEYFEGSRKTFDIPLRPEGTTFQHAVWKALSEIPYGKRISYRDLAKNLGDPGAVRAVAGANARNPIWIVIPCHRVVGTDGTMRGYAGGIHRKKWLLDHESPLKQGELFG